MERKKASDFPQELLDLFDLYVHGEIDRGTFLSRAGKFAVGGVTAAGLLAMLKPNYAWAQQVPKDDKRIRAEYAAVPSPHAGYIYPNTNHGFHNDTTPRYDAAAAKLAWQRTLDWFATYLRT